MNMKGTMSNACMRSRLGRNVRVDVKGVRPTVRSERKTGIDSVGGARSVDERLLEGDISERHSAM